MSLISNLAQFQVLDEYCYELAMGISSISIF